MTHSNGEPKDNIKTLTKEEFDAAKEEMENKLNPPEMKDVNKRDDPSWAQHEARREAIEQEEKEPGFLPSPLQEAMDRKFCKDPSDTTKDIAKGWSVILGRELPPELIPLCLMWVDICREVYQPAFENEVAIASLVKTLHAIKQAKERTAIDTGS